MTETYQQFLGRITEETKEHPYGIPKEQHKKFDDLSKEEQEHWNTLSKTRTMQMMKLAHMAFTLKTSKGIPKELSEMLFEDKYKLTKEDRQMYKAHFDHFMESHKKESRKSMTAKFGVTYAKRDKSTAELV